MRADEMGVLARLHPGLKADEWLARRFRQARRICRPGAVPLALYLSIFFYRLSSDDAEQLSKYLHLHHDTQSVILRTVGLKWRVDILSAPDQPPSVVHYQLRGAEDEAVVATLLCTESAEARRNIALYLNELRYRPPGPQRGRPHRSRRAARPADEEAPPGAARRPAGR